MSVIDKIRNAKSTLFTFELLPPLKGHSIERIYSTIEKLIDFLRELLTSDWLRFQRAIAFERLSGGMLDPDTLKLEGHMRGVAFTIAKLSELECTDEPEIIVEIQETKPKPQLTSEELIADVVQRFREDEYISDDDDA